MPGNLQQLFAVPGSAGLCTAGVMARLPLSTMGLGIFLMVSRTSGRYGLAATACGLYLMCAALAGPVWGSICDRRGQRFVLRVTALLLTAGVFVLVADVGVFRSEWGLLLGATVTGVAMPSVGAMVRTRWALIHTTPGLVPVAYSLESSLDEVLFIAGPAVIGVLTALWWPAGLVTVLGVALIGMLWLAAQPAIQPVAPEARSRPLRAILRPGMPILFAVAFAIGGILGATDVIIVARAPNEVIGPLVLALWAAASTAGGIAFAVWSPTVSYRRLALGTSAILGTTVLMLISGSFPQVVCVLTLGGVVFAPTMAVLNGLTERLCPKDSLTEAFAWLASGTALGAAAGTVIAGPALETLAGQEVFVVPVAFAVLAAALPAIGHLVPAYRAEKGE